MSGRVGVFGGTFDPPHVGHLVLAAEAHSQLQLSRLLWVLTAAPPHKEGQEITPVQARVEMVHLAIEDNPAFELSTIDIDRPGPHYTADTLSLARQEYPGEQIILLIGGDSLRDLPRWHTPEAVVAEADELGAMRRPGDQVDLNTLEQRLPGIAAKVRFIEAPLLNIASHEIRERARRGLPFRYYVPQPVYDYIVENHLYQRP
jgi:nicotinate-nucleotide adenylyltransferase